MKHFKVLVLIVFVLIVLVPPCIAVTKGYFYVVAYSFKDKIAYYSPIFTEEIRGAAYSNQANYADLGLLQKIEAAFKMHLTELVQEASDKFTISARGGYKSFSIAQKYQDGDINNYNKKGMKVENAKAFKFKK